MMHWLAELDGQSVTVEVPATVANLGAGFDCLALALSLTDTIEVEVRAFGRGSIELSVTGEGEGELVEDPDSPFLLGLRAALEAAREGVPEDVGWRVSMTNQIPLARGLGSSAAAAVGGLLAGNAFVGDVLDTDRLIGLAAEIEGHPDNAAAALLGGFGVVGPTEDGWRAIRFDVPRELRAVAFIPERRLPTDEMRDILPAAVPRADAVQNIGRVALGVAGLATGRHDLLRTLTVDRVHEPYRARVYPELPALVGAARDAGAIGACLAGAGSTIIAFADSLATITRIEAAFLAVAGDRDLPGTVEILTPRNKGATVTRRMT
jgi:homoserine kinase